MMFLPGKVWLTVLCAAVLMPWEAAGANALSELRGLRMRESRIPLYHRDRLQLLLYSVESVQKGRLLETTSPVLDIIRKDADVDTIDTGKNTKIYPLYSPFAEVFKFWRGHLFSDGVMMTSKADIDQENKLAAGGDKVYFRSPLLDLNGVGFDADYGKKTFFVRSDVQIVLRTGASDPLKYVKSGKLPAQYEFLKGTSETMLIDMDKRIITLSGKVRVVEERGVITCDRMQIVLPPENRKVANEQSMSIRSVSHVICEGHVHVLRTGSAELQQAFGERMVYDVNKGLLRLTGSVAKLPVLQQGKNTLRGRAIDIYRDQERLRALQDCELVYWQKDKETGKQSPVYTYSDRMDFDNRNDLGILTGNVRVREPRYTLNCQRMDIRLAKVGPAGEPPQKPAAGISGMPEFAPGGKKELRTMHCYGGVRMTRLGAPGDPPETATAREAHLTYPQQVVTMTGQRPTLTRGQDSLSGDKLTIDMKGRTLVAEPRSRIVFNGAGRDGKKGPKTEVIADRADLGYNSNLLVFTGNVKVRDPRMLLDCDKMDVYLKDAPGAGKSREKASSGMASIAGANAGKLLEKIICTGHVKAREVRMKMACDKLSLFFRQVTDAAKLAKPGMFQSQGTELVYIHTDGNVELENIPAKKVAFAKASARKSAAGMPTFDSDKPVRLTADRGRMDLPGNLSEFHGNVRVREEQGKLDCRDLYLYGRDAAPAPAKTAAVPRTSGLDSLDSLDDDPFAADSAAQQVPHTIGLGAGKELEKVVALKDVVLVRQLAAGGEQRATGQKAEYFVARRLVELTGEPPEYAQITDANPQNNGRSRKITVFLDRESVAFDGRVQMEFDGKNGSPMNR